MKLMSSMALGGLAFFAVNLSFNQTVHARGFSDALSEAQCTYYHNGELYDTQYANKNMQCPESTAPLDPHPIETPKGVIYKHDHSECIFTIEVRPLGGANPVFP